MSWLGQLTSSRVASVTNGPNFRKKRKYDATPSSPPLPSSCLYLTYLGGVDLLSRRRRGAQPTDESHSCKGVCKRLRLPHNVANRVALAVVAPVVAPVVGNISVQEWRLVQSRQAVILNGHFCEARPTHVPVLQCAASWHRECGVVDNRGPTGRGVQVLGSSTLPRCYASFAVVPTAVTLCVGKVLSRLQPKPAVLHHQQERRLNGGKRPLGSKV